MGNDVVNNMGFIKNILIFLIKLPFIILIDILKFTAACNSIRMGNIKEAEKFMNEISLSHNKNKKNIRK